MTEADARRTIEGDGPYDTACFHVQQAIEKSLKAVLAYHGEAIPRTHDLQGLAEEASRLVPALDLEPEQLSQITPFAVELRYDTDFWPDRKRAAEAFAVAVRQAHDDGVLSVSKGAVAEEVHARVLNALPPSARP